VFGRVENDGNQNLTGLEFSVHVRVWKGRETVERMRKPRKIPHKVPTVLVLSGRGEKINLDFFFFLPIDCSCVKRYIRANNIYLSFIFLSFYFPSSSPLPTEI
jgi:hypothetical protein